MTNNSKTNSHQEESGVRFACRLKKHLLTPTQEITIGVRYKLCAIKWNAKRTHKT